MQIYGHLGRVQLFTPAVCCHVPINGPFQPVFAQHKRAWRDNFVAGQARSVYKLQGSLEASFSAASTSPQNSGSAPQGVTKCKRGCSQICSLKGAFDASGLRPAKSFQRVSSYPFPKKQKVAHNRKLHKVNINNLWRWCSRLCKHYRSTHSSKSVASAECAGCTRQRSLLLELHHHYTGCPVWALP